MRSRPPARAAVWSALVLAAVGAAAALEVPYLAGRVNDLADLLSPAAEERIEARLEALEKDKGAQVAVLLVPSLEGDSLESFSLRTAETWKLGREKFDDGALLLIARDERRMRLEVGYGLEPVLTDALSGRILDNILRPRFRNGDFDGGVEAAVEAIDGLVRGDENALPPPSAAVRHAPDVLGGAFAFLFFLFVVGLFSLAGLFSTGCSTFFMYAFLTPFWFAFPIGILGPRIGPWFGFGWLVGFPIAWLLLHKTAAGKKFYDARQSRPWGPIGGWSSSRGWTSGGGGGFSGGGFSGGGGSFGGGGASSSW